MFKNKHNIWFLVGISLIVALLAYGTLISYRYLFGSEAYLRQASRIMAHLDHFISKDGYGGFAYDCSRTGSGVEACSQSQATVLDRAFLGVIWGRYQYYRATGDKNQLSALKRDIYTMYANLDTTQVVEALRANRFNCLLMKDLTQAPEIDSSYRQFAQEICHKSQFEFYPGSILTYDQHWHSIYSLREDEGAKNLDEPGIYVDKQKMARSLDAAQIQQNARTSGTNGIPEAVYPNQRLYIKAEDVVADLRSQLTAYAQTGKLNQDIVYDWQAVSPFLTRELIAAADQAVAVSIPTDNEILTEQHELDYLLLLRETFNWIVSATQHEQLDLQNLTDFNRCFMSENLTYFFDHYAPDFDARDRQTILNTFAVSNNGQKEPLCQLAGHYLNGKKFSSRGAWNYVARKNKSLSSSPFHGYINQVLEDRNTYNVYDNGLVVGILSQESIL
ncbi:hypothetical protein IJI99_02745 [bacterium]|nr:hypothetical protein [bacterium]